ncbi:MAG: hypothetical protein KIT47_07625 [Rhodoferax sp.]|nr:hypothetical protein [Rhodoferax sp.]
MSLSPEHVLAGAQRPSARTADRPRLLIAGATGVLGNAVVRRLVGMHRARHTDVLATMPMHQGMRHVDLHVVPPAEPGHDDFSRWPRLTADIAVVMFDPPRMFYGREKALWTPRPDQLPALGAWLANCGIHTLAVVLPHAQGSLPESLKSGLANLDEHALAALPIDRLILVRSARKPARAAHRQPLDRLAGWMLGVTRFMVPASEQPVRAARVAELVDLALHELPRGSHVLAPALVWQAAQGDSLHMRRLLRRHAAGNTGPQAGAPAPATPARPAA